MDGGHSGREDMCVRFKHYSGVSIALFYSFIGFDELYSMSLN